MRLNHRFNLFKVGWGGVPVNIVRDYTASDAAVYGTQIQIEQVITNLVRNAAEAAAETTAPTIKISLTGTDMECEITIADNGSGIEPEIEAVLFTPFQSTKEDGTGLGLSISKNIVEAHGGDITCLAHGELGGASFSVRLPVSDIAPDPIS